MKNIHLLYVPTIYCNLGCRYCYLGELTDQGVLKEDNKRALETLTYAVEKFEAAEVLPFNVSLHGGEVSTLQHETLANLFDFIQNYYAKHKTELDGLGFNKRDPHVKTNLYNFHTYYDFFDAHKVSISASIDLPFSTHAAYRRTKSDRSTLPQTQANLKLLAGYPHRKKFSSTLYAVHFERIDELIADIWFIHKELGYDMNYYNFMFGFESDYCKDKFKGEQEAELRPLTEAEQVSFYERMKSEFMGTELEMGLHKYWFEEFTPAFCTNSVNCGEKFFLLQSDGEVFSCVRGQGVKEFRYGNIFTDSVEDILANAKNGIRATINKAGIHTDCQQCEWLYLCNTGCPFVKVQQDYASKSYTCQLQKAIYRDHPALYPPLAVRKEQQSVLYDYLHANHPQRLFDVFNKPVQKGFMLPNDLEQTQNELQGLIEGDVLLRQLYASGNFEVVLDGERYDLESVYFTQQRRVLFVSAGSKLVLRVRRNLFTEHCKEPIRNTLYLQMLRDTTVVYGDEQRAKQEHTFTHQVFYNMLEEESRRESDFYEVDLMPLLQVHKKRFKAGVRNLLFCSTSHLRDYHYVKQRENAFYHIQAINLPFQCFEFIWLDGDWTVIRS